MTNEERIEEFQQRVIDLCTDDLALFGVRLACATAVARGNRDDNSLADQVTALFISGDYRGPFSQLSPKDCAHCLDYEEFGTRESDPGHMWHDIDYADDGDITDALVERLDEMLALVTGTIAQVRSGERTIPTVPPET